MCEVATACPPISNKEAIKLCKPTPKETKAYVFQQTNYRIKDPRKSIPFYTEVLGMKLLSKYDCPLLKFSLYYLGYHEPNELCSDLDCDEKVKWTLSRPATLELTHNWGTEEEGNTTTYNVKQEGYGHIGVMVPDLYEACKRFDKLGVKFAKRPEGGTLRGLAFIMDPDGYWIEIFNDTEGAKDSEKCTSKKVC